MAGRSARGQLALAVLACAAGAGLALYASGKGWSVSVTHQPAPLSDITTDRTGGDLVPWATALEIVSLAGAGALVATRRLGRRLVGGLLVVTGLGTAAGGGYGIGGATDLVWPILTLVCGLLVAGAGALAVRFGAGWPVMSSRYERPARRQVNTDDSASVWDALDRGEDPTAGSDDNEHR